MTWYYYSGRTPKPVPVKPGASISLRHGVTVEILMDSPELQTLVRKRELIRTGAPKGKRGADSIKTASDKLEDVLEKTDFSKVVNEMGSSRDSVAPVVDESTSETKEDTEVAPDSSLETSDGDVANEESSKDEANEDITEKEIAKSQSLKENMKKVRRRRSDTA